MSRQLAELLLKENLISSAQLNAAEEANRTTNEPYYRYFLRTKQIDEQKVLEVFSKKYSIPSFDLARYTISEEVCALLNTEIVNRTKLIPVSMAKGTIVLALADPTSLQFLDDIKFQTQMRVEAVITTFSAFEQALEKHYGVTQDIESAVRGVESESTDPDSVEDIGLSEAEMVDVTEDDIDAPIIKLVNSILVDSIKKKASDIHVEPYENAFRIRFRIDGVLYEVLRPPKTIKAAVIARIKIMARMDIAEKRLPQDGRIKIKAQFGEMDFRVSSMPTIYGEKIVMRLLDKSGLNADLKELGFEKKELDQFLGAINESYGMVLVTGPTGSGKTTTLYSAIIELNKVSENISTAEDPVEYNVEGINQLQTHADIGLNFATALRAFMRQDPDIILVGEVRDYETAEVAIQAALTGHLVLSTLHTNDAPSTITRLLNMGIEPFLVTASINLVVAQRLLRRICDQCKVQQKVPPNKLVDLGISPQSAKTMKVYRGAGCGACSNTGYTGRFGIYEVMPFWSELKEAVLSGANSIEIKKMAMEMGMVSMRMTALKKVAEGLTTLDEALTNSAADI